MRKGKIYDMKWKRKIISLMLCMALALGTGQAAFAAMTDEEADGANAGPAGTIGVEGEDYASGEVIVVFEEGTTNSKVGEILSDNDASLEKKTRVDGSTVALASVDEGTSVEEVIDSIEEENKVAYVQPNYKYGITATDPYYDPKKRGALDYQKQFDMTKAKEAWSEVGSVSKPTIVCVLDTGVDMSHEDLTDNLVLIDGKKQYRQYSGSIARLAASDSGWHGTHVAGIIGAVYGNGKGGAGIAAGEAGAPLVKVLPVGASGDGESLYTMDIVLGMKYAASKGARVINMSFGALGRDRVEGEAIKDLYYNKGITFVAAAGNERTDKYSDPSDMKEVISVCNYDVRAGATLSWKDTDSNYGSAKDISAPGQNILSTVPEDKYDTESGTSMAAPVVSGICALLLDANPSLTPGQVRNIICATAKENDVITRNNMGYGTVDAEAAVKAAKAASADDPVDSVAIKTHSVTLDVDNTTMRDKGYGMETLVLPAESLADVTWSSSRESVATVDKNGIVTPKSRGTCTITASAGGKTDTCIVTVKGGVDPTGISFSNYPQKLSVGEIYELEKKAKIVPSTATNDEVYWSSSDPKVALVEEGIIQTKKAGKCTITASTYNGHKASFVLTVTAVPTAVKFTRSVYWMRWGTTFDFNAQLVDSTGRTGISNGDMNWSISPKSCGSINSATGKFTPNKAALTNGYVYVYAVSQADDGSGDALWKAKKVTIIKRNYKGKSSYRLKKGTVKKRRATIRWKRIPGADRYIIQRAVGKKGKFKTVKKVKAKVVLKNSGYISYTNKKLAKNRVYRYRVRAQFKENGSRKSFGWSNTIKIKTKK